MAKETIPNAAPIWEIVFSREYLFYQSKIRGSLLGISFKTHSEAARNYGPYITVKLAFTREDVEELITNYGDKKDTYGIVSAIILSGNPTNAQIEGFSSASFNTDDISEISEFVDVVL